MTTRFKLPCLALLLSLLTLACSCSDDGGDKDPRSELSQSFDPTFAQVLQDRGYVADALNIQPEETAAIIDLDISGTPERRGEIRSLRGIGNLTSLETLNCSYNRLTLLDLTRNDRLSTLDCSNNHLSRTYLAGATSLTYLDCSHNTISQIDLYRNSELLYLDCSYNTMVLIDVSRCPKLKELNCQNNYIYKVDITDNRELQVFTLFPNPGRENSITVFAWFAGSDVPPGYPMSQYVVENQTFINVNYTSR